LKKPNAPPSLALTENPDILAGLSRHPTARPKLVIGFAAETQDLVENAREKLSKKKLDMIIANDAVASIGADASAITLITQDGEIEAMPPMPKGENAKVIVSKVAALLGSGV